MPKCNRCHKTEAKPGRKSCQGCITLAADAQRKLHLKRKAEGLCIRCGKPLPDRRSVSCPKCRKRDVGYRVTLYQKRIKAGLCGHCGGPATPGKITCLECREKLRDVMRKKRAQRPEQRAKERDGFQCQLCSDTESFHLDAHHMDGNGRQTRCADGTVQHNQSPNDDLDNLITLCRRCHLQVTYAIAHPVNLSRFIHLVELGRESSRIT